MRAGEILGLTFDEIDFERAEIRLPYMRTKQEGRGIFVPDLSH